MYNTDKPNKDELPTTGQLLRSTLLAIIAAVVILLTVVLPAEYAIDPTGAGRWLGLVEMGEIKQQLAEEAEADATAAQEAAAEPVTEQLPEAKAPAVAESSVAVEETTPAAVAPVAEKKVWRDEVTITLTPGQGTEVKLVMDEGAVVLFSWEGVEGPLNFDTHGDAKGKSISYEKGRGVRSDEGELKAAFTGNHGWFFRNRTEGNVTLILRMGGDYKAVKRIL